MYKYGYKKKNNTNNKIIAFFFSLNPLYDYHLCGITDKNFLSKFSPKILKMIKIYEHFGRSNYLINKKGTENLKLKEPIAPSWNTFFNWRKRPLHITLSVLQYACPYVCPLILI